MNLYEDNTGNEVQVFAPTNILLAQTSITIGDNSASVLLPSTSCRIKLNGTASFVSWPLGTAMGFQVGDLIEFEAATDVFVMG